MTRHRIILLVLALAGGGVGIAVLASGHRSPPAEKPDQPAAAARPPISITTAPVATQTLQQSVETFGTLHGYEEVTIAPKVEGHVVKILHQIGDRVAPGEPLLEIDPVDYRLALERAETTLKADLTRLGLKTVDDDVDVTRLPAVVQAQARRENLRTQLKRAEQLAADNAVAREQLDNIRTEFATAAAEYDNQTLLAQQSLVTLHDRRLAVAVARQRLTDAVVRAPLPSQPIPGATEGVTYAVTARQVAEGSYVRAGSEVLKLVIDRPLKLVAPVPERYAPEICAGQEVTLSTAVAPEPATGSVARINPAVDPATRTFDVEIVVPNAGGRLKAGAFARAAIRSGQKPHALTVPLPALVSFAGVNKVYLVENGLAREVPVTLGQQTAQWVEIVAPPLPAGSQVVLSGQSALADGSAVSIRPINVARRETAH